MSRRTSLVDFIARATAKHQNARWDYSGLKEINSLHEHVVLMCGDHGPFRVSARHHYYRGQGCEQCSRLKKGDRKTGTERGSAKAKLANYSSAFVDRCTTIHGGFYDYSSTVYAGAKKPVTVICPKHGAFEQIAHKHIMGRGCWDCGQKSAAEKDMAAFVLSLAPDTVRRDRMVLTPKEIDIWVPSHNLAIEYCGHYYHSTIKLSKAVARQKHVVKYDAAMVKGIRLLTIFEDEWANRRSQIEAMIRRAIVPETRLGARKCTVVDAGDFASFYEANHIQGSPPWGDHLGLALDGELVAAMTFAQGAARRGDKDWELSRFATSKSVTGGASRLFKALVEKTGAVKVWSFSDNRLFSGEMYQKLGFVLDGETAPDYSVVKAGKRMHKTSFRRTAIPARIKEIGSSEQFDPASDPRSEWEMTQLLGYGRMYDCGKKRWLWTA